MRQFILVLKTFAFGKVLLKLIQILLTNQESYVINGDITTSYLKMEKGARQEDLMPVFLFILVLEIVFIMIKPNQNSKTINIFDHAFFCTAYADDTTFFY